jgi:hypothetical protein
MRTTILALRGDEKPFYGNEIMKTLAKLAMGAVMATGVAIGAAAPADAAVFVRVGLGPNYHRDQFCYYHPRACDSDRYEDGYYLRGHGYWHHHMWYGHRRWDRDDWRYDR